MNAAQAHELWLWRRNQKVVILALLAMVVEREEQKLFFHRQLDAVT